MKLQATRTQLVVLVAIMVAAGGGAAAYYFLQPPEPDRTVAARIRKAKTISIEAKLQGGASGLEPLAGDLDGLAEAFRVVGPTSDTSGANVSVPVYDLDDASDQIILWMFPPDVANISGRLYRVDRGFWPALLDRAPKTKAWLDSAPKNAPAPRPRPRRPKGPAAPPPLVEKSPVDKSGSAKGAAKADVEKTAPNKSVAKKSPPESEAPKR